MNVNENVEGKLRLIWLSSRRQSIEPPTDSSLFREVYPRRHLHFHCLAAVEFDLSCLRDVEQFCWKVFVFRSSVWLLRHQSRLTNLATYGVLVKYFRVRFRRNSRRQTKNRRNERSRQGISQTIVKRAHPSKSILFLLVTLSHRKSKSHDDSEHRRDERRRERDRESREHRVGFASLPSVLSRIFFEQRKENV